MSDRHVTNDTHPFAMIPEALLYDPEVTANAVRVYGCLLRHGADPSDCYPSHARIARLLGLSARSVARPLAELAEAGWITKVKRPPREDGSRRPDAYHVHVTPRSTARPTTQDSAVPTRDSASVHDVDERDEREPVNENQENDNKDGALSGAADPALYEESRRLCNLLADLIESNGSKRPTVTAAWVAEGERMLRLDGREPDKVERCIRWCQTDPFWRGNILSMVKLRAKYDQLRLARLRELEARGKTGAAAPVTTSRDAPEGRVQL